ncbi:ImmA/IrrE family metallo-endopeptidase [Fodinibius sp. Rm-B-1B1-1]|uniref:ImmA/IrrE family metallo-endopeptidase n=1 Tax=Fodinibius alkaliphilus TaxID=3140241 RepID=UPI003159DD46
MSEEIFLDHINNILKSSSHDRNLHEIYDQRKEELDLSDSQIANVLQIDYNTLKRILRKEAKKIDYFLLLKLSHFLKIEPNELANIYHQDDTHKVSELGSVSKRTYLVENFDLKSLKSIGFIDSINDFESIENRILEYFGLDRLSDYDRLMTGVMFSNSNQKPQEKMRTFWIKSCYAMFEKIHNPNEYDRNSLKELIPKIRPYTKDVKKGFKIVIQALYNAGVTVIYQPYLKNTQVRGGTFIVNGKPCIVITNYQKRYPTIWFALIHELHHVLYDLDDIKRNNTFHLTGEERSELFLLQEDKADEFAREILFSDDKMKYVEPMINNKHIVESQAEKYNVHPSIIYVFYQWDHQDENPNIWGAFNDLIPDSDEAVKDLNLIPWEKETIEQGVKELKSKIQTFN